LLERFGPEIGVIVFKHQNPNANGFVHCSIPNLCRYFHTSAIAGGTVYIFRNDCR
jgi:hypothetical protein